MLLRRLIQRGQLAVLIYLSVQNSLTTMADEQLLCFVREDFYRTEHIPNVDGGDNMQYYFDAFSETHQLSSLRSQGVPERPVSPSCTEQVALENYLPGGFFTSNSLDQIGDVRIAAFEPPAAATECSNSTKQQQQQQQLEVISADAAAAELLVRDHYHHNSGTLRTGSRVSLKLQQVQQFLFDDLPQDIEGPGQPNSDTIHPSRNNSAASTSDCRSTSNVHVDIEVEIKPKLWRGCSPSTLMLQLQRPPASASKFSNFNHRPNNVNVNFDHQPINIITSTSNNTQSASQHQQLNHMPSMSAPSRPNPFHTQPRVLTKPVHHSYSNAERGSSFQPQSMCTKGAGDHNNINTSMTMSWATHLPDHQQPTRLRGATESCHHPGPRDAATSSECEVNAVDQSFTANSHVTLAGSSWPRSRAGGCSQSKLARVDNSSGNNSWSSCTPSSPSSNDHNEEAVGPINITSWVHPMLDMNPSHLQNFPPYVVSEFEKRRKKSQGTVSTRQHVAAAAGGITASEDGIILSAGNSLGDQYHHQKPKRPRSLKENLLHLIRQTDLHTSQECQIQVLDDTIECLNNWRRTLNDPTCISLQQQQPQREMGFLADATENCNESAATTDGSVSLRSSKLAGVDSSSSFLQVEKLGLDTEGVDYALSVDNISVPYLQVRMMKEHAVMVKLTAKDRPGLFNEIMMVLQNMGLDIQDGNIQTIKGERQDIFSVKMQRPNCSIDTQMIADALNNVIHSTT